MGLILGGVKGFYNFSLSLFKLLILIIATLTFAYFSVGIFAYVYSLNGPCLLWVFL